MRLQELNPKWIASNWDCLDGIIFGVRFDCPHCFVQRLVVLFDPPFGNNLERIALAEWADPRKGVAHVWRRGSGQTFDSLTLAPSINAAEIAGHWHGHIENGDVR